MTLDDVRGFIKERFKAEGITDAVSLTLIGYKIEAYVAEQVAAEKAKGFSLKTPRGTEAIYMGGDGLWRHPPVKKRTF